MINRVLHFLSLPYGVVRCEKHNGSTAMGSMFVDSVGPQYVHNVTVCFHVADFTLSVKLLLLLMMIGNNAFCNTPIFSGGVHSCFAHTRSSLTSYS